MAETRTLTFDLDELSNVAIISAGDVVDGLFQRLPMLDMCQKVHGKGGKSMDGGEKWKQDIEAFEHSVATALPTGYEEINLDVRGTDRSFIFSPAFVTAPIVISHTEKQIHHGKAARRNLAADRTKKVVKAQMRALHKHWLQGGQAGYDDWATLNGIDYSTGLLEEDAAFAQGNSYGGLSKSTLSAVPAMSNQMYDFQANVGANGRAGVLDVFGRIKEYAERDGTHLIIGTHNGVNNLKRVMQPYMHYVDSGSGGKAEMLGPVLTIDGKPVHISSHMPTGGAVTTADPFSLMVLDLDSIYPVWMKSDVDGCFGVTPFVQHSGSHRVFVAYVDINGQLWVKKYNSSAVFIDGEVF